MGPHAEGLRVAHFVFRGGIVDEAKLGHRPRDVRFEEVVGEAEGDREGSQEHVAESEHLFEVGVDLLGKAGKLFGPHVGAVERIAGEMEGVVGGQLESHLVGFLHVGFGLGVHDQCIEGNVASMSVRAREVVGELDLFRQLEEAAGLVDEGANRALIDSVIHDVEEPDLGAGPAKRGGAILHSTALRAKQGTEIDDRNLVEVEATRFEFCPVRDLDRAAMGRGPAFASE